MSLFSRFFGHTEPNDLQSGPLVANPNAPKYPLSFQVLFAVRPAPTAAAITPVLAAYHPSMASAACEIDEKRGQQGQTYGLAGWGNHVIKLVGFDAPMPREPLEGCIAPSPHPQEFKQKANAHLSHVLLYYAGYEADPLEKYVALAAVAGAMANLGAIAVLNESAHSAFPAAAFSGNDADGDMLQLLRALPLLLLYGGFVKYEIPGTDGVWMRTFGAFQFGVPDFAALAEGHHQGQEYFDIFESVIAFVRQSGAKMEAGHTMQIDQGMCFKFRKPAVVEDFLKSEGEMLVMDKISAEEIKN